MSQMSLMILLWGLIAIAVIMLTALLIIACAKPDPAEQPPKRHPLEGCVTYRDLLEVEHPEFAGRVAGAATNGCPASWGYEKFSQAACMEMLCEACWDRPVPEETLRELMGGDYCPHCGARMDGGDL